MKTYKTESEITERLKELDHYCVEGFRIMRNFPESEAAMDIFRERLQLLQKRAGLLKKSML